MVRIVKNRQNELVKMRWLTVRMRIIEEDYPKNN